MKFLSALAILLILATGCKDKFETVPQMEFKSSSSKSIPVNGIFNARFDYTDKEGDVDSMLVTRKRVNVRGPLTDSRLKFSVPISVNEPKGEVDVELAYSNLTLGFTPIGGSVKENDTLELVYVLLDKAKNKSKEVIITNVVVQRQQ